MFAVLVLFRMPAARDYTGMRFGRLVAIAPLPHKPCEDILWELRCDCGRSIFIRPKVAASGNTQSCGCKKIEELVARRLKHGHGRNRTLTPTYRVWLSMRKRCSVGVGEHREDFANYAGRGIRVCERWDDFSNFLSDMGDRPPGMTLERCNNDGIYEPGNCRWAPMREQALNKRNTRKIDWNGRLLPLLEACREAGVNYQRAYDAVVRNGRSFDSFIMEVRAR